MPTLVSLLSDLLGEFPHKAPECLHYFRSAPIISFAAAVSAANVAMQTDQRSLSLLQKLAV